MTGFGRQTLILVGALVLGSSAADGQVDLVPKEVAPGAWERFELRVINQVAAPTTEVVLTVPEAVGILAVHADQAGWVFHVETATDSTPQRIRWSGGTIAPGEFREFTFLGRVPTDARRNELIFPVTITKSDGALLEWKRPAVDGEAPVVQIVGTTRVTAWGAVAVSGAAVGLSVLALAIALSRRQPS